MRARYTEPGRHVVVYPGGEPGTLVALLLFRSPHGGSVPRDQRTGPLRERFDGAGWLTPSLLADVPAAESSFMDALPRRRPPSRATSKRSPGTKPGCVPRCGDTGATRSCSPACCCSRPGRAGR
ncbi:hypothetical protein [[Actinomadura] parvosata]|uniref:hypothetical protein n=1 Tax=[Actinomadura] parvosata TaxID=1955412 RepID=UPI0012BC5746|nr:hypothetical protein [Nonomuraea sp. ATCC 55076]